MVADRDIGVPGGDHLAHAKRAHDLTDTNRWDVGARIVHPATHRRVQGDVEHLHHNLAVGGLGRGPLGVFPVAGLG